MRFWFLFAIKLSDAASEQKHAKLASGSAMNTAQNLVVGYHIAAVDDAAIQTIDVNIMFLVAFGFASFLVRVGTIGMGGDVGHVLRTTIGERETNLRAEVYHGGRERVGCLIHVTDNSRPINQSQINFILFIKREASFLQQTVTRNVYGSTDRNTKINTADT